MDYQLKQKSRGAKWRYNIWTFIKAQLSAQFASFVDFLVTILLVKVFGVFFWLKSEAKRS